MSKNWASLYADMVSDDEDQEIPVKPSKKAPLKKMRKNTEEQHSTQVSWKKDRKNNMKKKMIE